MGFRLGGEPLSRRSGLSLAGCLRDRFFGSGEGSRLGSECGRAGVGAAGSDPPMRRLGREAPPAGLRRCSVSESFVWAALWAAYGGRTEAVVGH